MKCRTDKVIMRGISVTMEDKRELKEEKKWWKTCIENMGNWLANKNKDEWLKDMRGNLSLAATIITTMTFQTAINPPGGVRPATETGHVKCTPTVEGDPCPGTCITMTSLTVTYMIGAEMVTPYPVCWTTRRMVG
ncbi:uncharacterized protein LOC108320203 isoform X5 [Vigna angularis]|uniref:uncharacterized protein LOC108320203 isoform X5 n=1 Tax=Phaseolus angularis TaxID=3914 RepID=UPI0022B49360|nr:uncharacterized protein LOC108320203 isoform X5 [Vigna angularis]